MHSGVNKLVRRFMATVLFVGAAVSFIGLSQDANAQRRSQNRQEIQPYYYGGSAGSEYSAPSLGYSLSPSTSSRDGRFDPIPPSANGG